MTNSAKLQIRASEIRQRLNTISGLEGAALTDEIKAETGTLAAEYSDVELRMRAAMIAEDAERQTNGPTVDAELRERIGLRGRARLGNFLLAAARGALPNGAEAELFAASGIKTGIPIDLWESSDLGALELRSRLALETRVVTPAPATGTGTHVQAIQPAIFDPSILSSLRIDLPSAESGAFSEMVIGTPPTAAPRAKSAQFVATAGALTAVTATPRRISAAVETTLEDVAAVGTPSFESSLKAATSMALSAQLDQQGVNGDGTAPAVDGLVHQLTRGNAPTALATFDDFNAGVADRVDGIWSRTMRDVRFLVAAGGYARAAKVFRDDTGARGSISAASYLMDKAGGFSAAARLVQSATIADAIAVSMGRGGLRIACLPVWASVNIDDIYSQADKGTRVYNMHVLIGSKVIVNYPDAYDLVLFKFA